MFGWGNTFGYCFSPKTSRKFRVAVGCVVISPCHPESNHLSLYSTWPGAKVSDNSPHCHWHLSLCCCLCALEWHRESLAAKPRRRDALRSGPYTHSLSGAWRRSSMHRQWRYGPSQIRLTDHSHSISGNDTDSHFNDLYSWKSRGTFNGVNKMSIVHFSRKQISSEMLDIKREGVIDVFVPSWMWRYQNNKIYMRISESNKKLHRIVDNKIILPFYHSWYSYLKGLSHYFNSTNIEQQ